MKKRPKVNTRRGLMEFGILQHLKGRGVRKNCSTKMIIRKSSSLTQWISSELPSFSFIIVQKLQKLKSNLDKGRHNWQIIKNFGKSESRMRLKSHVWFGVDFLAELFLEKG